MRTEREEKRKIETVKILLSDLNLNQQKKQLLLRERNIRLFFIHAFKSGTSKINTEAYGKKKKKLLFLYVALTKVCVHNMNSNVRNVSKRISVRASKYGTILQRGTLSRIINDHVLLHWHTIFTHTVHTCRNY